MSVLHKRQTDDTAGRLKPRQKPHFSCIVRMKKIQKSYPFETMWGYVMKGARNDPPMEIKRKKAGNKEKHRDS